jgi:arylsulfatase A-like enzyme
MLVRWPGRIAPGRVSDLPWAFWDVLPTLAELAGAKAKTPAGIDGLSVVPTLLGQGVQKRHEFLYWEFHEGPSQQAVRMEDWKAIRKRPGTRLELYDLRHDLAEQTDVAARYPEVVSRIEAYLETARSESEHWPIRDISPKPRGAN